MYRFLFKKKKSWHLRELSFGAGKKKQFFERGLISLHLHDEKGSDIDPLMFGYSEVPYDYNHFSYLPLPTCVFQSYFDVFHINSRTACLHLFVLIIQLLKQLFPSHVF